MADPPKPSGRPCDADRSDRGVAPAVGKVLEIGVVVLFVGVVTTALYAGVVPDYRTAAGDEVGDRVLVAAADEIRASVPPEGRTVAAERRVDLPTTIRTANYRLVAADGRLRLAHPNDAVSGTVRLALPDRVARVEGTWRSGADTVVRVESTPEGLVVRLVNR